MWESIEGGKVLMHRENTTFICHSDFSKYMKSEGATSKNIYNYLFDIRGGKFLSGKGKTYLYDLFEKLNPKHLKLNKDFDDYIDKDGLEDIVGI